MSVQTLPRVLIVDDFLGGPEGAEYRSALCEVLALQDTGWDHSPGDYKKDFLACVTFESGQELDKIGRSQNSENQTLNAISRGWPFKDGSRWALVCVDLQFDVGEKGAREATNFGAHLLRRVETEFPLPKADYLTESQTQLPVVMLSSHSPEFVEDIIGPHSNVPVIEKWTDATPDSRRRARIEFAKVLFKESLAQDGALKYVSKDGKLHQIERKGPLVGTSYALLDALRKARRILSKTRDARVLLMGEQGAGKELAVSYMHDHRPAAKAYDQLTDPNWKMGGLEDLHLRELPETLFAAALKGTEKGFATQVLNNESAFERAGTGTLHLDEIANVSNENLQILLRLVENDHFKRIGGKVSIPIKCQVIATTNKDIKKKVEEGEFPSDLFDRFDKITIPPLRQRGEDIDMLFRHFLSEEVEKHNCRPKKVHGDVFAWISNKYEWYGNVRQLRHVVENIVAHREYAGNIDLNDVHSAIRLTGAELQRTRSMRFDELLDEIRTYRFSPEEVDGAWPKLQAALGVFLGELVEAAGRRCHVRKGRVARVECVTLIQGPKSDGGKRDSTDCLRWLQSLKDQFDVRGTLIVQLTDQAPGRKKSQDE